jgi:hypothetical protein
MSIDFLRPMGSEVVAARAGIVRHATDHHEDFGRLPGGLRLQNRIAADVGIWLLVRGLAPPGNGTNNSTPDCERGARDVEIDVASNACP